MKTFFTALMIVGLTAFLAGCTEEAQLDNAVEDLQEQQVETQETMNEAARDNVITPSEQAEIREEKGEQAEQAGDVVEQAGDVIDKRSDN